MSWNWKQAAGVVSIIVAVALLIAWQITGLLDRERIIFKYIVPNGGNQCVPVPYAHVVEQLQWIKAHAKDNVSAFSLL